MCSRLFFVLQRALVMTFSLPSDNWADTIFFPECFCSFEETKRTPLSERQSLPFMAF